MHQWEMFVVMQGQLEVCLYEQMVRSKKFVVGDGTGISVVEFSPEIYIVSNACHQKPLC